MGAPARPPGRTPGETQGPTQGKARAVVALVLAAGSSRRMGPDVNKLVSIVGGKPLVAGPVDALIEAGIESIFVVTGYQSASVRSALADRSCVFIENPDWMSGMGSSIAAGLRGILARGEPDGVLVCVGDLAGLRSEWIEALLEAFAHEPADAGLVVPSFEGRSGHPVLFGRRYFEALCRLEGESGGRSILRSHSARVKEVAVESDAILRDLDTPADFEAWTRDRRP